MEYVTTTPFSSTSNVTLDSRAFRDVFAQVPAAVAIVTTVHRGIWFGLTVSSVASVSDAPPMLSVCINRSTRSHAALLAERRFCVNFLTRDKASIAAKFGGSCGGENADKFAGDDWRQVAQLPVLEGAYAALVCAIAYTTPAATHTLIIGNVLSASAATAGDPLLYARRRYTSLIMPPLAP